jgi:hypothetical protein
MALMPHNNLLGLFAQRQSKGEKLCAMKIRTLAQKAQKPLKLTPRASRLWFPLEVRARG